MLLPLDDPHVENSLPECTQNSHVAVAMTTPAPAPAPAPTPAPASPAPTPAPVQIWPTDYLMLPIERVYYADWAM